MEVVFENDDKQVKNGSRLDTEGPAESRNNMDREFLDANRIVFSSLSAPGGELPASRGNPLETGSAPLGWGNLVMTIVVITSIMIVTW